MSCNSGSSTNAVQSVSWRALPRTRLKECGVGLWKAIKKTKYEINHVGQFMADPGFFKGGDLCKGQMVTILCLITKTRELGACFLYFSYVLA